MLKPPKWLWFLDLTVGVVFVSGIASFVVWRRSEDFRKSTFSRVPRIADYFYRAEDIIGGQLRGTRLKRKDYHKWFPEEDIIGGQLRGTRLKRKDYHKWFPEEDDKQ